MNGLRRFGAFWVDFLVGDDWRIAVGAVISLGITALLVHAADVNAWWLLPAAVVVVLATSLRRALPP